MTQLTLWDNEDSRPLPLIVADKWNFALAYITPSPTVHSTYLYAAQDWYEGLAGNKVGWRYLKKQLVSSTYKLKFEQAPYVAKNKKTYQSEYINEKGLYIIAQEMRAIDKRPQIQAIRVYLAAAGVFANLARTQPEQVAKELTARAKGIQARNAMTDAAQATKDDRRPFFGILTDKQYELLLGRKKREIVALLGMSPTEAAHFRDQLGEQALDALRMAEGAAAVKMRSAGHELTHSEQLDIVVMCSEIVAPSYHKLVEYLQVDKVRNQPMLKGASQ